jgi:DNA-binding CsgD family transcriptional regulator/DNA polymerase III delta prime subunit
VLVTVGTQSHSQPSASDVVGRDAELLALDSWLDARGGTPAKVLVGPPGIGKTTLYEAAIRMARGRGYRVLSTRATGTALPVAFTALIDLCDGIGELDLEGLPGPQRAALEVALLRTEPAALPPNARAIAMAFRGVVRNACAQVPTMIAIDDVQWLDLPSQETLTFLAQRLSGENLRVLMTRSAERPSELENAFEPVMLERGDVGPLSFGAVRRLLLDQLGLSLSRPTLHRIVDDTEANPLFVLEVGRSLLRGDRDPLQVLPIPAKVEDLLQARIASLPAPPRWALMALALCPDIGLDGLTTLAGQTAVDGAVDSGLIQIDGQRVRASHPLLGATVLRDVGQEARRELHLALAHAVLSAEQTAVHLALATPGSDEAVAETVATAAARASARGARQQAVVLAEHALRITPLQSSKRSDRVLVLASYLETAGEMQRLTELLTTQMESLPSGGPRAWALLMLSEGTGVRHVDDLAELRRRALAEDPYDVILRARVLAKQAANAAGTRIVDILQAEAWATEAERLTRDAAPGPRRSGLYALAWARAMRGLPVDDLCRLSEATSDVSAYIAVTPERVAGQRHVWRGEIAIARAVLGSLMEHADERGEIESYALMRLHMCELHLRVGEWDAAEDLLTEWGETADRGLMFRPKYERCQALLAAGRGDAAGILEWAGQAVARGQATGSRWDEFEGLRADAMGSLLAREPAAAVATLTKVWDALESEGVDEPGVFPIAPELVQALVESGDLPQAQTVTNRLAELAARHVHPWASITVNRCQGMVSLAETGDDDAAALLAAAADAYWSAGLPFDAARCLLSLGRGQRRRRQWGSARSATEQAETIFEAIGSSGWATHAGNDLERLGTRRTQSAGRLTASELRTAELAASGLSNKEISRELAVSVHTVEVHLSRVYAKLGIRSRGQLAARLHATGTLEH